MRAGLIRHRIVLQTQSTARDSYGAKTVTWSSNKGVWAEIKPLRGSQYFDAQQVQSGETHKIRIRHTTLSASTAIGPGRCRVKYGDRYFNIHAAIDPDERHIYLDLMCSEEV